jgi:hypothetical protein
MSMQNPNVAPVDDWKLYQLIIQDELAQELLPELLPYVEQGSLGEQLRHPLLYQVPLLNNGGANRLYKYKVQETQRALAESDWKQYIWLHERPYRVDAFIEVADKMSDRCYWETLAAIWSDTENGWQNLSEWQRLFDSDRPERRYLMDEDDFDAYSNLPDVVTVYRGCQKNQNENGLSWTLDKSRADFFAHRLRDNGVVLEKKVSKNQIVAVLLGRNEQEVIIIERNK